MEHVRFGKHNIKNEKGFVKWCFDVAPIWFNFLEWASLIGLIIYVGNRSNNFFIKMFGNVSFMVLSGYLFAYFPKLSFIDQFFMNLKIPKILKYLLPYLIACSILASVFLFIQTIVSELSKLSY